MQRPRLRDLLPVTVDVHDPEEVTNDLGDTPEAKAEETAEGTKTIHTFNHHHDNNKDGDGNSLRMMKLIRSKRR